MEKTIYIAGGCFWGVQGYFDRLKGVNKTVVGYANGNIKDPTYQQVKSHVATHAETVKIDYEDNIISLEKLLQHFLRFVDPYSLNKQKEDEGIQYRSGVYYIDEADKKVILDFFISCENGDKFVIEVLPLANFYKAEEYHQDYLIKNPLGYCHVNFNLINDDEKK